MKKHLLLLLVLPSLSFSQVEKGDYALSFGVGSSFVSTFNNISSDPNISSTPVFNAGIERMMHDHFALGIHYSFIKYRGFYSDYRNGFYSTQYTQIIEQNPGLKGTYLATPDKKGTFTASYRIGFDIISISNPPQTSGSRPDFPYSFKQRYTQQIALGGRFRFDDAYSGFLEFGLGSPYFFNAGLNIRF